MLLKRKNIYYFRWQIPVDLRAVLGKREIVKSLHTNDKLQAHLRALPYLRWVSDIKTNRVRNRMDESDRKHKEYLAHDEKVFNDRFRNPKLISLSDENIDEAIKALWTSSESTIAQQVSKEVWDGEELKEKKDKLDREIKNYSEVVLTKKKYLASEELGSLSAYGEQCMEAVADLGYSIFPEGISERLLQEYLKVEAYVSREVLKGIERKEADVFTPPSYIAPNDKYVPSSPLFSVVYEDFIKLKKKEGLKPKMQSSYARYYADWKGLMPDKGVADYRKPEIRDFILSLANAPKRILMEYKNRPISELLEIEDIPEKDIVAPKTAREAWKWLQGVFSFAVTKEFLVDSPAKELKLDLKKSAPYAPYTNTEIRMMLEKALDETKEWRKWLVWIAAYTGMRRGEIVQLRSVDIKSDDDSGRHYFLVTDEGEDQNTKTDAAKRRVPIHQKLIDQGLLELVASSTDRLFPNLKPERVTAWFTDGFRQSCGISRLNDLGQRKTFHSFRHTVITKMISAGNTETLVQQIVGHEKKDFGVTATYIHQAPVGDLTQVIDCLEY